MNEETKDILSGIMEFEYSYDNHSIGRSQITFFEFMGYVEIILNDYDVIPKDIFDRNRLSNHARQQMKDLNFELILHEYRKRKVVYTLKNIN